MIKSDCIHASLVRLLTYFCESHYIALLCDDIHWADHGTLEVIKSIVSKKDGTLSKLILAISYRDEEVVNDTFFQNQLYKRYAFKTNIGSHKIVLKRNGSLIEEYNFKNYFLTRVVVDYNGKTRDNEELNFIIDSQFVFKDFVIQ